MNITIETIKSFSPCQYGIANFESKYPNFNDTLVNLLKLNDVPYNDKIWLATRVCETKDLQQWSVECAEFVLPNYESQYPNDTRIRDCLEVTKRYLNGNATSEEVSAAWSAWSAWSARSAARSAAWSAAESAAWSARSAAESAAESAARSAAWSAAWSARSAEWSARSAAESAAESADEQETINLGILIAILENK